MKILVDCDAMPRPLKDVLCKVSSREKINIIFVAAQAPALFGDFIQTVGAGNAFNGADDWIVEHTGKEDLVITADIPLADRCLSCSASVLNTHGEFFTLANIKNAMAMRELMDELRVAGEITGGPPPFSERQRIKFINALNRWIQKNRE